MGARGLKYNIIGTYLHWKTIMLITLNIFQLWGSNLRPPMQDRQDHSYTFAIRPSIPAGLIGKNRIYRGRSQKQKLVFYKLRGIVPNYASKGQQ